MTRLQWPDTGDKFSVGCREPRRYGGSGRLCGHMAAAMTPEPDVFTDRLEEMGEHQVDLLFKNGGFPTTMNFIVTKWLREKREAAEKAAAALAEKQTEIASSSRDAAWASARAAERSVTAAERSATAAELSAKEAKRANRRANFAIVISLLALLVASLGPQDGASILRRACELLALKCAHP